MLYSSASVIAALLVFIVVLTLEVGLLKVADAFTTPTLLESSMELLTDTAEAQRINRGRQC